jgi:flagellar biosynthesis component FlhA
VKHLPLFLSHQEVMDRLEATDPAATSIARDSTEVLTAVTAILRALLEERVPVVSFKTVAAEFASRWTATNDLASIVAGIRLLPAIRPKLWGNNRDYSFYRLSEGFEKALRRQLQCVDGIGVLVMEQEEYWKTLSAIREKVAGRKSFALVVRDEVLRPVLRKLLSSEFPDLPVLSYAELLPDLGFRILGYIKRGDEAVVEERTVMVECEAPAHG